MKKNNSSRAKTFKVSTSERPDYCATTSAVIFDSAGNLLESSAIKDGKLTTKLPESKLKRASMFIVPVAAKEASNISLKSMNRLNAYQAVISINGQLKDLIQIPGNILDLWLFCSCYVHGRVIRQSDHSAICGAKVHICEVDKVTLWIRRLPDYDLFKIREDLLDVIYNPPKIGPKGPVPDPPPFVEVPPTPLPVSPLFRFNQLPVTTKLASRQLSSIDSQQTTHAKQIQTKLDKSVLSAELLTGLQTQSASVLRDLLASHWKLLYPWFCIWPWWRLRCDEIATVTTDANGRFEKTIYYPCAGDKPDLYFWVEYDLGNGYETVYRPLIGCHTYWNYQCGSEVTLRVADPRVPGCTDEPDLPGCQVLIKSIGNNVAVKEVHATDGLLANGDAFGGTLEPRVGFSRHCLIEEKEIPYYRWSYRRLSGPDGSSTTASTPASEKISTFANPADAPASDWTILTREVVRHYKDGNSYPADVMGPMPTSGANGAPIENLFRIRPTDSPSGEEWHTFNQHVDLATGYFETNKLLGSPESGPQHNSPAPEDLAAGRYELKLELFDKDGNLVNWTDSNIDLRITDNDAPFDTSTIETISAPNSNRIMDSSGDTIGFKMILRVDNNHCFAEVLPVEGDVTPDPVCGFHTYQPGDQVRLKFVAQHPNNLATYTFNAFRASGPGLAIANTSGIAGEAGASGYLNTGNFNYQKDIAVASLLGSCANAAYAERLDVVPMVQNGYSRLHGLRHSDTAAFALAQPCEPCDCEDA